MTIDSVSPSVPPGPQQNVAGSSATQPSLQKVKPGNWASPAGSSTLTHRTTKSAKKSARTLIKDAIADSKRDAGALHEKLANAFGKADADVREAMRATTRYHDIVQVWARDLVRDAWNAPRTTIHPGDQAMRELHRVATGLPPEIAADLVVAAAPEFVDYSKYTVRHDKDKPAIFSSNDRVLVSMPSPGEEASKPGPEASKPNPNVEASTSSPDVEAPKPSPDAPDVEASKPDPDVEDSKPASDVEASQPNPDVEASKPSPDPKASVPKYEKRTYLDDLTAWIRRAEIPNPKQDDAIRRLEALVDKS
jgi:hypothetical protein